MQNQQNPFIFSSLFNNRSLIFLLFFPASLGILWQIFNNPLSHQLLAFTLFLMCLEQARMAFIDLENIIIVKEKCEDNRLDDFFVVTMVTIIIELLGFYLAFFSLYWGAIVILISLIFFNLFAKIQLQPSAEIMIQSSGISQKLTILCADGLGLILIILGMFNVMPLLMSSLLLGIIILYGLIKYI
ncbi:hypothetical protein [Crocosphaera sp. XPORK-15E]|uniref:hypothetical protein n=1 Tax=Crocosphaera sp. XPORK-15E TaxID=3110247 RepID=UPI002B200CA8|nr:hypothetical protein [Crocosphaera sp. XPORK-15E]MEA5535767.1 hypothetical protein [Crocosphaera sp. XPORK-15E]